MSRRRISSSRSAKQATLPVQLIPGRFHLSGVFDIRHVVDLIAHRDFQGAIAEDHAEERGDEAFENDSPLILNCGVS